MKYEEIKKFITKLQSLPEHQKKFIALLVLIFFGLILAVLNINPTKKSISKIEQSVGSINLSGSNDNQPEINAPENTNFDANMPNMGASDFTSEQNKTNVNNEYNETPKEVPK